MRRCERVISRPTCSVIIVERTQTLSTREKMNCSKRLSVAPKLKPKPVYGEPLWRSYTEQLAPPPVAFASLPQKVVPEYSKCTENPELSENVNSTFTSLFCDLFVILASAS